MDLAAVRYGRICKPGLKSFITATCRLFGVPLVRDFLCLAGRILHRSSLRLWTQISITRDQFPIAYLSDSDIKPSTCWQVRQSAELSTSGYRGAYFCTTQSFSTLKDLHFGHKSPSFTVRLNRCSHFLHWKKYGGPGIKLLMTASFSAPSSLPRKRLPRSP